MDYATERYNLNEIMGDYVGEYGMKIVLGIFSRNDKILLVSETLKKLGHDVRVVYTDAYRMVCPYYKKKLDKLGLHGDRVKYEQNWKENLYRLVDDFIPQLVLFVNAPTDILQPDDLAYVQEKCKTACWFVDGISYEKGLVPYFPYFDDIFVFEECDVNYLKQLGKDAIYLPVGYNSAFKKMDLSQDIDISFIGSPFPNRLKLLDVVARAAEENNWNLKIIGPFYDTKYPWKKYLFKYKHPHIDKFLENRTVSPAEASEIYNRSKICLNIHAEKHKSPNPRTFEIMATGAFELMDYREYLGCISEKDCGVYTSIDDLKQKISLYLENQILREQIAQHGYELVKDELSMCMILNVIVA